jgi:uncharacterized protein (DUF3084 family)
MQAAVTSEWSRLQTQIADLDGRMATLNESVRRLESDLESRLAQVASDIVAAARTQLQSSVDVALKDLTARNAKELQAQLDEACGQLNRMRNSVEVLVSGALDSKMAETLKSFEGTMEQLAQDSVGRWRGALARNLSEVARVLGEQFRSDHGSER